jgi:hypothetical protein
VVVYFARGGIIARDFTQGFLNVVDFMFDWLPEQGANIRNTASNKELFSALFSNAHLLSRGITMRRPRLCVEYKL